MSNNDSRRVPHALGCEHADAGCKGACLKPTAGDSLDVRLARYEDAIHKREAARIAVARAQDAFDAAKAAVIAASERASKASDEVFAVRAALREMRASGPASTEIPTCGSVELVHEAWEKHQLELAAVAELEARQGGA